MRWVVSTSSVATGADGEPTLKTYHHPVGTACSGHTPRWIQAKKYSPSHGSYLFSHWIQYCDHIEGIRSFQPGEKQRSKLYCVTPQLIYSKMQCKLAFLEKSASLCRVWFCKVFWDRCRGCESRQGEKNMEEGHSSKLEEEIRVTLCDLPGAKLVKNIAKRPLRPL